MLVADEMVENQGRMQGVLFCGHENNPCKMRSGWDQSAIGGGMSSGLIHRRSTNKVS